MCQNVLIPSFCIHYSVKIKNWFYFFFRSSDMQKFHHLLGCHAIGIFTYLFLSALRVLNLLCQAKGLIRILRSGSSSSKLLSRLILLKFTLRMPISSQQNVTLPESSSKKSKPSSAHKAVESFLIILLVTNQSEISFNAARESSNGSSQIFWVIFLSGQYTIIKGYKETAISHIS